MAAPRETEKSKLLADSAGASGAVEREMEQRSLLLAGSGEENARAKFDDPSFLTSFDDGRRVKVSRERRKRELATLLSFSR